MIFPKPTFFLIMMRHEEQHCKNYQEIYRIRLKINLGFMLDLKIIINDHLLKQVVWA